ncbi:hypothetical protein YPPY48_3654, partial [Yersinia pestis PY-48]
MPLCPLNVIANHLCNVIA